jgi:formylglycine-generating enzyme required for sulfatase activity
MTFVTAIPEMNFTNSVEMVMVRISKGYWVSAYEVTQAQFEDVTGYNPSANKGPSLPIESLTIDEALGFCSKLTELEEKQGLLPEGFSYTLPTYKQWLQYVADAGLEGSVTPVGYHDGEILDSSLPVGSGEVNKLGIYDLRGNVCEWSIEPFQGFKTRPTILGASWNTHRKDFLSIYNKSGYTNRADKSLHVGFRCVLVRKEDY